MSHSLFVLSCSHLGRSASIFRQTAEVLDGVVEFGAVNCASEEGKPICERNNVHQSPAGFDILVYTRRCGAFCMPGFGVVPTLWEMPYAPPYMVSGRNL